MNDSSIRSMWRAASIAHLKKEIKEASVAGHKESFMRLRNFAGSVGISENEFVKLIIEATSLDVPTDTYSSLEDYLKNIIDEHTENCTCDRCV